MAIKLDQWNMFIGTTTPITMAKHFYDMKADMRSVCASYPF